MWEHSMTSDFVDENLNDIAKQADTKKKNKKIKKTKKK